ncbi:MAG: hypothetical protein JW981_06285, partial [Anaerolineae bacterium]|nr:hypothetical protein [Anaerolineae bacterium]
MLKKGLSILLLVGALVLAFPLMVAAQGGPPDTALRNSMGNSTSVGMGNRGASRGGWLTGGVSMVDATAEVTGMPVADVIAALQSGQAYADIAASAGVAPQAIVDVMLAVRAEALSQAVAAGRFTQDQVDIMLARMSEDLLAKLSVPWVSQGAGYGYSLDGTSPQDGSGYRG